MTVSTETTPAGDPMQCAIGGHQFTPYCVSLGRYAYTAVDGVPLCPRHFIDIGDAKASTRIDERMITRAVYERDAAQAEASAIESMRKRRNDPGWIYYIRTDGLIKIGYTADMRARRSAYSPAAELLAVHPGTRALETQMHQRFAELRERGREWFRDTSPLTAHIEEVRAQFGAPDLLVKPMRHARKTGGGRFATQVLS